METDKEQMGFWIFSLADPAGKDFYDKNADDKQIYYAVYIEKVTRTFPDQTREVMHLYDGAILLLDSYLMPIYYRLGFDGYVIAIAEKFCGSDEIRGLLKLVFFYTGPEGIIDMGLANDSQRECMELIYREYGLPYDDFQPTVLRNLAINMAFISSTVSYDAQIKSGHLLSYALQFMELVDQYVFQERRKSFYANRMGITEKMLAEALQFVYHKTFRDILVDRTLIRAMQMLVFSDKSMANIAQELNCDASDFIRLFLRHKGMTPGELRQSYRKIVESI
ncbi:hypothetical protein FACS1894159_07980 [Bacteroidia bacterium]|nr:hypothetical protein FACS1894159_07980 [Bacteroidia bacterium]